MGFFVSIYERQGFFSQTVFLLADVNDYKGRLSCIQIKWYKCVFVIGSNEISHLIITGYF